MKRKALICPQRLRQLPRSYSWVDHRLMRDGYINRCTSNALALYLFLITVGDHQGVSYYSDCAISRYLGFRPKLLSQARDELVKVDLIAYEKPLYQVLELRSSSTPRCPKPEQQPRNCKMADTQHIAQSTIYFLITNFRYLRFPITLV
jgi:hypothetical protein